MKVVLCSNGIWRCESSEFLNAFTILGLLSFVFIFLKLLIPTKYYRSDSISCDEKETDVIHTCP